MNVRMTSKLFLTLSAVPFGVTAQPSPTPTRVEPYRISSGVHENPAANTFVAFSTEVAHPGTPWIRLHFSDAELGEASYVEITSVENGAVQRLNSKALEDWGRASAISTGDAVQMDLVVGPGERGIFIVLSHVTVSDPFVPSDSQRIPGDSKRSICAG